jgi:hypothetical protein
MIYEPIVTSSATERQVPYAALNAGQCCRTPLGGFMSHPELYISQEWHSDAVSPSPPCPCSPIGGAGE